MLVIRLQRLKQKKTLKLSMFFFHLSPCRESLTEREDDYDDGAAAELTFFPRAPVPVLYESIKLRLLFYYYSIVYGGITHSITNLTILYLCYSSRTQLNVLI